MDVYIPTRHELEASIGEAVEKAVAQKLPEIVSKVARKPVYSLDETCELLEVSRRHLQYLRDTGQISFIQNGRKIYFRAEDLDEFFEKNYIKKEVLK